MRATPLIAPILAASVLGACAGGPETLPGTPDYTLVAQGPQSDITRLYGDCLQRATQAGTYGRSHDADTEMIRFNCEGPPAQRFFEALEHWSAAIDSGWQSNGWTYRSTTKVQRNLFGVDWCASDGQGYACVINLNVGEFATPAD